MLEKGAENTDFTYYTEEQQKQFFETDLPAAGEAFAKSISDYCIANGYVTIEADEVANGMNNWGFADLNEDGSITSASGKTWTLVDGDVPTLADYWNELEMKYDYDYATLSETEAADAPLFDFLSDSYKTTVETGESAPNITGIQKTGEYSVRFVMTEANGPALTQFQAEICPLHYYGDETSCIQSIYSWVRVLPPHWRAFNRIMSMGFPPVRSSSMALRYVRCGRLRVNAVSRPLPLSAMVVMVRAQYSKSCLMRKRQNRNHSLMISRLLGTVFCTSRR